MKTLRHWIVLLCSAVFLSSPIVKAGIFDLPAFLEPNKWSTGIEPEVIVSKGPGAGLNIKPRYGVNNFLNLQGFFGFGSGSRGFRMGGIADLEIFPDFENQPGIAVPVGITYSRLNDTGDVSFGPMPMVYKTFRGQGVDFIPFVSIPMGWRIYREDSYWFTQVALGSMFKLPSNPHIRFTAEAGFNISESFSYMSGGVTYYH